MTSDIAILLSFDIVRLKCNNKGLPKTCKCCSVKEKQSKDEKESFLHG